MLGVGNQHEEEKGLSLEQVRVFVEGNPEIEFEASNTKETCQTT